MDIMDIVMAVIQSLCLLAAVVTIIYNQRNESKRHKLQFFAEYTRRYQDIILRMPDNSNDPQWLKYMQLYFDLCSEEFYLNKIGHIDKDVWKLWVQGMEMSMGIPLFHSAWQGHLAQYYSDEDFIHFMSELIRKSDNKKHKQS